jgi:chromosome segregation ATPase
MAYENNNEHRRDLYSQLQRLQNDVRYTRDSLNNAERERDPAERNYRRVESRMRSFGY